MRLQRLLQVHELLHLDRAQIQPQLLNAYGHLVLVSVLLGVEAVPERKLHLIRERLD